MRNDELISIVVPIYNVEKYLEECVNSIMNQTYQNLEIILVDDGSTDSSGKMCDEIARKDSRIKVIHKKNGGLSDARNAGIELAKGQYLQFVDSDDYMELNMVEILYNEIKENNAEISLCSYYILKDKEVTTDATYEKGLLTSKEALEEFLLDKKIRAYAWNKMFSRELFNHIRFPVGRVFEDQLTIPKLFAVASKIALNNMPLYYYRQREGSILHNQTKELRLAYINAAFEIHDDLKRRFTDLHQYINYNISHITMNTYNDIALFKMYELLNEEVIQELYQKTKEIFDDTEMERFIIKNSANAKKIHYYYLLEDKDRYIRNHRYLPVIYPEHRSLVEKS